MHLLPSNMYRYTHTIPSVGCYVEQYQLDNIQARPFLMQTAPESWLGTMLTEWLQRAPEDTQGSSSVESLMLALSKCGIGMKLEQ